MERNFNLDLCLSPSGVLPAASSGNHSMTEGSNSSQQQQMTIFYNGRVCVCDVTETQARAIICLASREAEERSSSTPGAEPPVSPPALQYKPPGLSMKRSLQMFLQKRRNRKQAALPYNE